MDQNILVTGCRRSGTTFLGRVLTLNKEISYLNEPFNYNFGLQKLNDINVYPYYTSENISAEKEKILKNYFQLKKAKFKFKIENENFTKKDFIKNIFVNRTNEDFYKRFGRLFFKNRAKLTFLKAKFNPFRNRILIKDPIAALSSRYLNENYDIKVVVIIRHPAAFYYSMKKQNWGYRIKNYLNQKKLINNFLLKEKNELKKSIYENNLQERIIWEWKIINKILFNFADKNDDFIVIRHKDICINPLNTFEKLYKKLNLNFDYSTRTKIKDMTSTTNQKDTNKVVKLNRDSSKLPFLWKENLTCSEIDYIKSKTFNISSKVFSEDSWK